MYFCTRFAQRRRTNEYVISGNDMDLEHVTVPPPRYNFKSHCNVRNC